MKTPTPQDGTRNAANTTAQMVSHSPVLRVLRQLQRRVLADRALRWLQRTRDKVQERTLSGTVRAKNGDAGVHAEVGRISKESNQRRGSTHSIPKLNPWYK